MGDSVTSAAASDAIAAAYASEWGRVVATLIRITGEWGLAEDCAQDAFEIALERWTRDGVPPNPGAWLTTVAKNRAIDKLRRSLNEADKLRQVGMLRDLERLGDDDLEDDRLRLVFTCCHPALPLDARVALTLRTVAGLTTPEIARAFLVPESTMAQRLVRAKAKIREAGIPYRVPPAELLGERLPGVLAVVYLLFTEGYAATSGTEVVREPLADEAIRLAQLLRILMPEESEVTGLLALMQLQHARRAARTDARGDIVSIEDQDRSLWDAAAIDVGVATLRSAGRAGQAGRAGSYQLQARIAATHAVARSWASTDFEGIVAVYDELVSIDASPVIAFNRAVAIAAARGAADGLAALDEIAATLPAYYLVPAARADFLRRLERMSEAAAEYRRALELVTATPERAYLERRLAEVSGHP